MTPDPKDPLARALELVDELELGPGLRLKLHGRHRSNQSIADDLRTAIRAMGEESATLRANNSRLTEVSMTRLRALQVLGQRDSAVTLESIPEVNRG